MFGQVIIGPPGSGKTTYCRGMAEFLKGLGRRVVTVNLDPANDHVPGFVPDIDVTELITVKDVMEHMSLGPNGALVYCMEYLLENSAWLLTRLNHAASSTHGARQKSTTGSEESGKTPETVMEENDSTAEASSSSASNSAAGDAEKNNLSAKQPSSKSKLRSTACALDSKTYFLFDFPGQVELYTHHSAVKNLLALLQKKDYRLVTMQLMDSTYCLDPGKYISVVLTALSSMIQLETPLVNVLSKADLLARDQAGLPFGTDFFTDVLDLGYLVDCMPEDDFVKKYSQLSKAICGVVQDYSLVSFNLLNVSDKQSMLRVLGAADKANGFCFGSDEERSIRNMMSCAYGLDRDDQEVAENQMLSQVINPNAV